MILGPDLAVVAGVEATDREHTVTIEGTNYTVGDEIFAFIPQALLRRLQEFSDPETHVYMVDGPPMLYRSNTTRTVSGTEYFEKTLVFGERSGGRRLLR